MSAHIDSHNTENELNFLNGILSGKNTPNSPRNHKDKVKALEGYLKVPRANWVGMNKDKCIEHAKSLLHGLR